MQDNDPFHRRKMVTCIHYFSASGHSKAVAEYLANELQSEFIEIPHKGKPADVAIVVFPVYCQNIPPIVQSHLPKIDAQRFILVATYGRMSFGNVLAEAAQLIKGNVIAAAYVPTGHSYLKQGDSFHKEQLDLILKHIDSNKAITIPRFHKNIFADFFPGLRSRMGVKITRSELCNKCGLCTQICPNQATKNGVTNHRCIRCLRCVNACPQKALDFQLSIFMKWYLRKPREERFLLFD